VSMVYEGTRGETGEEMQSVFHFPEDDITRRSNFAAIHNRLNKADAKYTLSTANSLWVQEGYDVLKDYLDTIESYYLGEVNRVDFRKASETSQAINGWIESKTNNKIKDMFSPGSFNEMTRVVLANAVYFKGKWVKQFDKSDTTERDFRAGQGSTLKVPTMELTGEDAEFNYMENDEVQVLEMLYDGEDLSMIVILPRDDDPSLVEESLTAAKLDEWKGELAKQRVDVFMPKFSFTLEYSMSGILGEMGMPTAFVPGEADLSGIGGTGDLFIQAIVHKAFVDVNEEGTEAAAATGIVVGATSAVPEIKTFRADHPFMFIIQHRETGNVLFMGRVVNPLGA
jgi:serpin B